MRAFLIALSCVLSVPLLACQYVWQVPYLNVPLVFITHINNTLVQNVAQTTASQTITVVSQRGASRFSSAAPFTISTDFITTGTGGGTVVSNVITLNCQKVGQSQLHTIKQVQMRGFSVKGPIFGRYLELPITLAQGESVRFSLTSVVQVQYGNFVLEYSSQAQTTQFSYPTTNTSITSDTEITDAEKQAAMTIERYTVMQYSPTVIYNGKRRPSHD